MNEYDKRPNEGMTPETKTALKWGAIGALIAIPVPFVGPLIGGVVGGGLGYAKAKGKI
ncbi:hypothetical protein [Croceicoccus sp. YJ47]|uniref:hypothetical protein n=1 Tax=Croceicoccus sp. YJ47 TaxID=2798724 RepID=UPI00192047BF|nr:hypothetical protein [Croceicoccus sp. YJ47]QQN74107.1 hypothetical protein JD971_15470 [Croceicoccus sp. YJ47]